MNGPGRGRGRGRGGFKGNRFDRERERGPQIDTWTNETAENAAKENSSKYSKRLRIVTCAKGFLSQVYFIGTVHYCMRVVYVISNSSFVWLTDWAEGDDWTADEWTGSVSFNIN